MDLATLKAHIKTRKFNSWYIFTGPEVKAMDIYINQMASMKDANVVRLDSIQSLMSKLNSKSFVRNAQILILRDCKEFLSDDKLQARITQNNANTEYIIIFIYFSNKASIRVTKHNFNSFFIQFNKCFI